MADFIPLRLSIGDITLEQALELRSLQEGYHIENRSLKQSSSVNTLESCQLFKSL
jgi:hypothetical protein